MLTDRLQVTRVSQSILTMIYRTFSIFGSRLPGSPADYIGGLRDSGSQHSIIPASFFGRTVFKGQFPSVLLTFRIAGFHAFLLLYNLLYYLNYRAYTRDVCRRGNEKAVAFCNKNVGLGPEIT
ncbi:MAG: hypothetical protein QF408_13215 [Pirellulales bacterium]|nr:hypothetical protein [Pirellulales bacterium]